MSETHCRGQLGVAAPGEDRALRRRCAGTATVLSAAWLSLAWLGALQPAAAEILSAPDIGNLCRHAALHCKVALDVLESGRIYREKQTVVLGIRNLSTRWRLGQDDSVEQERLHDLSTKLGKELARPGRVPSEYLSVARTDPKEELWQQLDEALLHPRSKWLTEDLRLKHNIGWVMYGYMIDVPGKEKPYTVLKMTDLKDRFLVWGGCFSMQQDETGSRHELYGMEPEKYPTCTAIAGKLVVPNWAKPEPGAILPSTYWFQQRQPGDSVTEEEVFADLLVIEFLNSKTLRPQSRWIDPGLVRRYADEAAPIPAKEGQKQAQPAIDYRILEELYGSPEWQRLNSIITGSVELERPNVRSALLKCVKLVPAEKSPRLDAFVMSGYCSKENDYEGRLDWVASTISLASAKLQEGGRVLRVVLTDAFQDRERFRDIVEVAIARSDIAGLRVIEGDSPNEDAAHFRVMPLTDESEPARSLYFYVIEQATERLAWARNQTRPGIPTPPDPTYLAYCTKARQAICEGATGYGTPAFVWYMADPAAKSRRVGTWDYRTVGKELVAVLTDPSRTFIHTVGKQVFGTGGYPEMIEFADQLRKSATGSLRAIVFQLLDRGAKERPALVVKYLDPDTGMIDWAYWDERPGDPLAVAEEDDLLTKVSACVKGFQEWAAERQDPPLATVVGRFADNGLLDFGERPYQMMVAQLAARRVRPPVEWGYLAAKGVSIQADRMDAIFSKEVEEKLAKLSIASICRAEWVPSSPTPDLPPGIAPRQLILWETSLRQLQIERYAASPLPADLARKGAGGLIEIRFLHELVQTFVNGRGPQDPIKWEKLTDLSASNPAFARVLGLLLQDYRTDPGLTQNTVIRDEAGQWLVSTGTTEETVKPEPDYLVGLRSDAGLAGKPKAFLVALRDVCMSRTERQTATSQSQTALARLYPPDWRDRFPDDTPLLRMPDETAVTLLRRNLEFLLRKEGFSVVETVGLQCRYAAAAPATGSTANSKDALPEALVQHSAKLQLDAVQLSLAIRDLRAFMVDAAGKSYLAMSAVVRQEGQVLPPQNRVIGLPDDFRFVLLQDLAPEQPGAQALYALIRADIDKAGATDLKQAKDLWQPNAPAKARELRDQIASDLATWYLGCGGVRETITKLAGRLLDEAAQQEVSNIAKQRTDFASQDAKLIPTDQLPLRAAQDATRDLLSRLAKWTGKHPDLKARTAEVITRLAQDAIQAEWTVAQTLLDKAARNTTELERVCRVQAETDSEAARTLINQLLTVDLKTLADANAPLISALAGRVTEMATRTADVHKGRANSLMPVLEISMFEKKEKKEDKIAYLKSLQGQVSQCIADLGAWSAVFPELRTLQDKELARTPDWDWKDWEKVPAKTLGDVQKGLQEKLKRFEK